MRFVFWQNSLSFYQAPHIRGLAERGHEVYWVAQEALPADRKLQGWDVVGAGNATVIVAPDEATIDRLVLAEPGTSTHIFTGVGAFPMVKKAFHRCLRTNARMGLLVENRDGRNLKGAIRYLRHKLDFVRFGSRIDFILAMGYAGEFGGARWYRKCGYPASHIYPYGYFPDPPNSAAPDEVASSNQVRLMYLGQCIPRKGVDVLIEALALLTEVDWILNIVGDGPSKPEWMDLVRRRGLSERVYFHSSMANKKAMEMLGESDLFILPSRFDGWGVVINESLLCGVPVICSDRCGAADLLQESWRGGVFSSESVPSLHTLLKRWTEDGRRTPELSNRIRDWSKCIIADSVVDYLIAVLQHSSGTSERPQPPWFPENKLHDGSGVTKTDENEGRLTIRQ